MHKYAVDTGTTRRGLYVLGLMASVRCLTDPGAESDRHGGVGPMMLRRGRFGLLRGRGVGRVRD